MVKPRELTQEEIDDLLNKLTPEQRIEFYLKAEACGEAFLTKEADGTVTIITFEDLKKEDK